MVNNNGQLQLRMADVAVGNQFNGNVVVECINGGGVGFGVGNGEATLATTQTVTVGAGEFNNGTLTFRNFTQVGGTSQALTLTGTALLESYDATWNAPITFISPRLTTRGTTYEAVAYLEKNGAGNSNSIGGNVFNQDATIVYSGTNEFRFALTNPDIFNATTTLVNNNGQLQLRMGDVAAGNQFNGNVVVECMNGGGVGFGVGNGEATLATARTVTIGAGGFDNGTLSFTNFIQLGSTAQDLALSGTATLTCQSAIWNGDIEFSAPQISSRETVYQGTTSLLVNGTGISDSYGLNTFNGPTTLINSGTNRLRFATSDGDTFNASLSIRNLGTSQIWMADNGGTSYFNGQVIIESVGSNGVLFGRGGNGYSELADTYTVTIGGLGFDEGSLSFRNFAQLGATPQHITLSGTGYFLTNSSSWNGNVVFSAPRINTFATTYNGTATIEKTGATNDLSTGLNVFNQNTILRNHGSGYLGMGQTNHDVFNADLVVENTGDNYITIGYNSVDNLIEGNLLVINTSNNQIVYFNQLANSTFTFNGNIEINSSATANGIRFGETTLGTGAINFSSGNSFTIGTDGFHSGELRFVNFNQVGSEAINLDLELSGTGFFRSFESTWNGNLTISSPRITTRGTVYNGITSFEKTGITDDASTGGNIFNDVLTLINTSPNVFRMGNTAANAPDVYNGVTILRSIGNSQIQIAYASIGNELNNDVIVESVGSTGVTFGGVPNGGNGSITLADTHTITIGAGGFDSGRLLLRNFTQVGGTAQNITLTGTATLSCYNAIWNGNIDFITPQFLTRESVYNGTAQIEVNGTATSDSYGLNTFNGATTLINSGTNRLRFATTDGDTFNAPLTIRNTGTNQIWMADNGGTTFFNDNVILESVGSTGVLFGRGANGFSELADTYTITIGGLGFNSGSLSFRNFVQLGGTAQALTLTGTALLSCWDAIWNAPVTFISPQITTRGTTYNDIAYLEKNGATTSPSTGGNTFNANVEFVNSSTAVFRLANTIGDDFNANVIYTKINTGAINPTYGATSTYAGDITINSNTTVTLADAANGRVQFDGSGTQNIINSGAGSNHIIRRVTTNKSGGEVILQTPIIVRNDLNLVAGNIVTDAVNLLIMNDNSTVSSVSDAAYVSGPLRKIGNDSFDFPVGKGGVYRPISISAPTTTTHHFTAEFFNSSPDDVDGLDPAPIEAPIENISDCEYWILDRTNGTSNVNVTLSYKNYGSGCSGVTDPASLAIARWDGATWRYHEGTAVGSPNGSIITNAPVTSFSPFALASTSTISNPLPIELISFEAAQKSDYVVLNWMTASEINNEFFTIEKSADGVTFKELTTLPGAGNSTSPLSYSIIDENPFIGVSYYRLSQTDFDGTTKIAGIAVVEIFNKDAISTYPNPINKGDVLFIDLTNLTSSVVSIQIIDGLGKSVLSIEQLNQEKIAIATRNLAPGMYYLKVLDGKQEITKKIIIQ